MLPIVISTLRFINVSARGLINPHLDCWRVFSWRQLLLHCKSRSIAE